ncbi:N-acetylglucosamine-6-phosphate deacetylase [Sphaeroforma arctica JP610]|uniref:N-acetylglucosamine-6-phosphate deacetylase n=1 Tax=Sphaeroforma arctica JP610 TaxID=667725 RepID=A0A0L0FT00_9EUKA|nr:N-acetylglucosamine-6-phosphate deacetylase [Sphaeroforma arctica JP610]KNC79942.1 N-acetylglucosamine-6-phosphate deacetylase [Sphaeroforma arctica JP610]|eukprot:XP_014153844.1 N-acetylglucosamine-6-phosphate deacetylase [Sphaeroforma arctica JP610]
MRIKNQIKSNQSNNSRMVACKHIELTDAELASRTRRRSTSGVINGEKPDQPHDRHQVLRFVNCKVFKDNKLVETDLWVQNGKIIDPFYRFYNAKSAADFDADVVIDGHGAILSPGFIEIQINGAFGVDFSNYDCELEDIQSVGRNLMQYGVTSFCPTLVTSPQKKYHETLPKFVRYAGSPEKGATNLGLHLEGPFMSMEKKGAHDPKQIEAPVNGFDSLLERYGPALTENVSYVTIAPEREGAIDAIKGLKEHGVLVSLGHSSANMEESIAGLEAGGTLVTHMFNAMASFHHRDPGLVGVLGKEGYRPYYGIIADGIHSHPNSIRIAYQTFPEGLCLVTDAMAAAGLPEGRHQLGDLPVDVEGIRAVIAGTNTLAGSAVDHVTCIKNFKDFTGCSIAEVLRCATSNPAASVNVQDRKGRLEPGMDADLVLLSEKLSVQATFIDGELCYVRDGYTIDASTEM